MLLRDQAGTRHYMQIALAIDRKLTPQHTYTFFVSM